jgi:hypothetical protein
VRERGRSEGRGGSVVQKHTDVTFQTTPCISKLVILFFLVEILIFFSK